MFWRGGEGAFLRNLRVQSRRTYFHAWKNCWHIAGTHRTLFWTYDKYRPIFNNLYMQHCAIRNFKAKKIIVSLGDCPLPMNAVYYYKSSVTAINRFTVSCGHSGRWRRACMQKSFLLYWRLETGSPKCQSSAYSTTPPQGLIKTIKISISQHPNFDNNLLCIYKVQLVLAW